MKNILEEIGINLVQSLAGLLGSLLLIGKQSANNIRTTLFSILTGVASANYLTPVVAKFLSITDSDYKNGIAFVLGFLGLRGVEIVTKRITKNVDNGNTSSNK